MYSKLIVLVVFAACVVAAPPQDVVPLEKQQPTVIPIISQSDEVEANGTYKFSYETGNGIKREEEAYEKVLPKVEGRSASSNEGGESDEDSNEIHVQRGSYSYTAPDGTVITLSYIADENGFQPIGDHIPRVPGAAPAGAAPSGKSSKPVKDADSTVSASEPKKVEQPAEEPVPTPVSTEKMDAPQTTVSTNEAPVTSPATTENSADLASTSIPPQSTSAEATEGPASTVASEISTASNDKQTTLNPVTETSQSAEAGTSSTNAPKADSVEESASTTVSA